MTGLLDIGAYVQKTAVIIGSVLEMEILVCDHNRKLIGDTEDDEVTEYINENSILTKVMNQQETIIIDDKNAQCKGCQICPKKENCPVKAIIGFPIQKGGRVYGAMGIYASSYHMTERLLNKKKFFIEFISNMSDLLISKLEEKQENVELKAFQKKFSRIVESIDIPILGLDENREVIHCNKRFRDLFQISERKAPNGAQLLKALKQPDFIDFINNCSQDSQKEFTFSIRGKETLILVEVDAIDISRDFRGALIYFKKVEDLYDEVNRVTNNYTTCAIDEIIGESPAIRKLKEDARKFAGSDSTILIQGESGTGKGLLARAIHSESSRSSGPFVVVNCAAIPDNLLESELFGHEEGAFTGSMRGGRVGKFELANKGTLFLDEIGELPIHLQPKLLRAVQEKKIERVGGRTDIHVDIRIIAATNKNLEDMMLCGEFREDLYYRLNVIPLVVPPLRERPQDISLMIESFMKYYASILNRNIDGIEKEAERYLLSYPWKGNVRELQNIIEYAVNAAKSTWIVVDDLPDRIINGDEVTEKVQIRKLKDVEAFYIQEALKAFGDDIHGKDKAAKALGISRATLYRKINQDD
ncbi:sigma-54 interaction domain-containing protein [Anaerovorax sp. IOR16]|uniref:sigma-54 interaction domain-containing protein n=1 Tax=Anaerovorax sp. IOR16 TaxID=2773458 RepID=UPI0019D014B1|nr:sigma 54-interacting transcriptional regulator [Anaerovorax sp. IOR16]